VPVAWGVRISTWDHRRTDLCTGALGMALQRWQPQRGLILHSDRGVQYASEPYRAMLQRHGVIQPMSRRGNCLTLTLTLALASEVAVLDPGEGEHAPDHRRRDRVRHHPRPPRAWSECLATTNRGRTPSDAGDRKMAGLW
jgi:transposase InsO family protein